MFKKVVKYVILNYNSDVERNQYGNWIDLAANGMKSFNAMEFKLVPLGVKMTLPKWYRAELKPRSSLYKNYRCLMTNSPGEIEADYSEEWMASLLCTDDIVIPNGARIVQFNISLRSDAPWYKKLENLFISGYKFVQVESLTTTRGGFGSTGK